MLGEREMEALLKDALVSQEEHERHFRTDSLGRTWRFSDERVDNRAVFQIRLQRMDDVRTRTVSAAEFGTDGIAERLDVILHELSEALS